MIVRLIIFALCFVVVSINAKLVAQNAGYQWRQFDAKVLSAYEIHVDPLGLPYLIPVISKPLPIRVDALLEIDGVPAGANITIDDLAPNGEVIQTRRLNTLGEYRLSTLMFLPANIVVKNGNVVGTCMICRFPDCGKVSVRWKDDFVKCSLKQDDLFSKPSKKKATPKKNGTPKQQKPPVLPPPNNKSKIDLTINLNTPQIGPVLDPNPVHDWPTNARNHVLIIRNRVDDLRPKLERLKKILEKHTSSETKNQNEFNKLTIVLNTLKAKLDTEKKGVDAKKKEIDTKLAELEKAEKESDDAKKVAAANGTMANLQAAEAKRKAFGEKAIEYYLLLKQKKKLTKNVAKTKQQLAQQEKELGRTKALWESNKSNRRKVELAIELFDSADNSLRQLSKQIVKIVVNKSKEEVQREILGINSLLDEFEKKLAALGIK